VCAFIVITLFFLFVVIITPDMFAFCLFCNNYVVFLFIIIIQY